MLLDKTHIQYLHDNSGNATAVLIPIKEWKAIEEQFLSNEFHNGKNFYWMNV